MLLFLQPPRLSHQALLDLEKGTESAVTQLKEAARIIDVDLDHTAIRTHGDRINTLSNTERTSAPKEEWVLRWLMKKLNASSSTGPSNYQLNEYSWLLFQNLINRIPPKNLAATLNENKFMAILIDAVTDLET